MVGAEILFKLFLLRFSWMKFRHIYIVGSRSRRSFIVKLNMKYQE